MISTYGNPLWLPIFDRRTVQAIELPELRVRFGSFVVTSGGDGVMISRYPGEAGQPVRSMHLETRGVEDCREFDG